MSSDTRNEIGRKAAGVILAGGVGRRAEQPIPKQYLRLGPYRVIDFSIGAFLDFFSSVVVVTGSDPGHRLLPEGSQLSYAQGGATRTDSVLSALRHVDQPYVVIHDAARPFVTAAMLDSVCNALRTSHAACPVLPVVNTLVVERDGRLDETPERSRFREVQTPQAFRTDTLRRALAEHRTAHAHLPELVRRLGHHVAHVDGSPWLLKITYEPSVHAARYHVEKHDLRPARLASHSTISPDDDN